MCCDLEIDIKLGKQMTPIPVGRNVYSYCILSHAFSTVDTRLILKRKKTYEKSHLNRLVILFSLNGVQEAAGSNPVTRTKTVSFFGN